jgi:hypothetical protein
MNYIGIDLHRKFSQVYMYDDRKEKERKKEKQEPATVKQIGYLKILGVSVNKKITKKKAGRLIEMTLRNNHSKRF